MPGESSSAARKQQSLDFPIPATILAVVVVGMIHTLTQGIVLQLLALLMAEAGNIPDIGWAMLVFGVPRVFFGTVPRAIAFVAIFWVGREAFLHRWALYGALWSLMPALGLPLVLITNVRTAGGAPVLQVVLSIAAYMLSAYVTKAIFNRVT